MTDGADLGVRFGILCWNQYTDWESLEQVGRRSAQGGSRDAVTFSGTPEHLAELLVPYVELGFRHIYFDQAAPWDDETLERLMTEVRPMVETRAGAVESRA
jgi:hypothetical protein